MQKQPLWKALRPQRIEDFVGYEDELNQLIGLREGAILFHGPIGCGKTSAALALVGTILGKPLPIGGEAYGATEHLRALHRDAQDFEIEWLEQRPIYGSQLLILDEAQELTPKMQSRMQVAIEKSRVGLVCFCTSKPSAIQPALQSRCTNKVKLGPLAGEEREELALRAWKARGKEGMPPDELFTELNRFDPATAPRTLLNAVDLLCDGATPKQAARNAQQVA
jgi:replication-associated recombination protein RarA